MTRKPYRDHQQIRDSLRRRALVAGRKSAYLTWHGLVALCAITTDRVCLPC